MLGLYCKIFGRLGWDGESVWRRLSSEENVQSRPRSCDDFMNLEPELSCEKIMREGILILPENIINGCLYLRNVSLIGMWCSLGITSFSKAHQVRSGSGLTALGVAPTSRELWQSPLTGVRPGPQCGFFRPVAASTFFMPPPCGIGPWL